MKELLYINGKWYRLLLRTGGRVYCSNLFDEYNEVAFSGSQWDNQPFFRQQDVWYGELLQLAVHGILSLKRRYYRCLVS